MDVKTYIIIPDLHVPYHDPAFIELVTLILKISKADGVVQLGDAVDWWQLSNYDKDPKRLNRAYDDLVEWGKILNYWDRTLKKGSVIHLLEGNHEQRQQRHTWKNNRENYEMIKSIPDMLELSTKLHETTYHSYDKWDSCQLGDVFIHHGFFFTKHLAANCLDKYRCKFIQGHSHRLQYVSNGNHWACSLGHGALPSVYHLPVPPGWQQAIGELNIVDGKGELIIIPVNKGQCVYRGKLLDANLSL